VVYVGKPKKQSQTYVSESAQLVRNFFQIYEVDRDIAILHDGGNSFKEKSESIFEILLFKKHITYPAVVHQYLSPNDNRLHGTAKQKWRNLDLDMKDDQKASICLLSLLDEANTHVQSYFQTNMQLDQKVKSLAKVHEIIGTPVKTKIKFFKACLNEFRIFQGQDARGHVPSLPPRLASGLDGSYWNDQKNK